MFDFLSNLPPELLIASLSALPFTELRGSIPLALGFYNLSAISSFSFAVLGNLIPAVFILLGLGFLSKYLRQRYIIMDRFFNWLFGMTARNHEKKFKKWKELALLTLVAVPLPLTGAWMGSLCAFVFGIPFKKAFPLISLGVIISGVIVTALTLGFMNT